MKMKSAFPLLLCLTFRASVFAQSKPVEWLVPITYDHISAYSEGDDHRGYIVQQNEKYGWLDENGRTLLPPSQDMVQSLRGGMVQVNKERRIFLADETGRVLVDSLTENAWGNIIKKKGRWLVIDSKGKVEQTYPISQYSNLTLLDDNGNIWATSGRMSGLIQGGKVIIPIEHSFFRLVDEGIVSVHKNSTAYLYDMKGKLLFSKKGNEIEFMFGDFVTIRGEGLFNWKTQTFIYPTEAYIFTKHINDSLFICENTQQYTQTLFNKKGQQLGQFKDMVWHGSLEDNPMVFVEKGLQLMIASAPETGLQGIINFRGEWVVKPKYHKVHGVGQEMFAASLESRGPEGQRVKIFRLSDQEATSIEYQQVWKLNSGKWYLEHPSKGGVFDLKTTAMTYLPQGLTFAQPLSYEDEVYLRVKKGQKMGLLDLNFEEVVPPEFDIVGPVTRHGVVVTALNKKGVIKRK